MDTPVLLEDVEKNNKASLAVTEIFSSIQGEGAWLGVPVTFIRLQGCNVHCPFCDSKKTWAVQQPNMSTAEIVEKCDQTVVVITGGEPCMQDLAELISLLHLNDKLICMETSGSLPIPDGIDWVTCSPKAVIGYGLAEENLNVREESLYDDTGLQEQHVIPRINEWKFVVTPDFEPEQVEHLVADVPGGCIWLQPESSDMKTMWKKAYDIAMKRGWRVGVQLHVLMGVE